MSKAFRFGIMGAGKIGRKFCEAVNLTEGAQVAAVSSRSLERAGAFARAEGIPAAYGSYEEMLRAGGLDCVYIAATMEAHYALAMLCLDYRVPFLCEKAAFLTRAQAEEVLGRCRELGVFGMEAMWSRFLPANQAAREKLLSGAFGEPRMVSFSLGFRAPQDNGNRYFSPALGGGVSYDLTVYTYELLTFFLPQKPESFAIQTLWGGGGVDVACNILVRYPRCLARLQSSFLTQPEEDWVIDTDRGRLSMPHANGSTGWRFTPVEGEPVEYRDTQTKNGFVYEIQEVIRCVRGGLVESPTAPHSMTMDAAGLYDLVWKDRPQDL